jgi:rhomboid protease GluP
MKNSLISYFVANHGYISLSASFPNHSELLGQFDHALSALDEYSICLFKTIDGLKQEEIENSLTAAQALLQDNLTGKRNRYHVNVFLICKKEIDENQVQNLLNLPLFENNRHLTCIIADEISGKIIFNPWTTPVNNLLSLLDLRKKIRDFSSGDFPPADDIENCEINNRKRLENFQKALFNSRPYLSWVLILINLVIWITISVNFDASINSHILTEMGAKVAPLVWEGEIWRLFTPAFLHVSFMHLLSNCLFIYFLGSIIEPLMGRWRLAVIYVLSIIFGNLVSMRFSPYLSAGASSAVFGMIGALIGYFLTYRKQIPRNYYRITSLYLFALLVYSFLVGITMKKLYIDNFAHIGGVIGGLLAGTLLGVEYPPGVSKKIKWFEILTAALIFTGIFITAMTPYDDAYKIYYYIKGEQALTQEDYVKSISFFERSLEYDDEFTRSRNLLGRVYANTAFKYFKNNEWDSAVYYFRKSLDYIELKEENYEVLALIYEYQGNSFSKKKDTEQAIRYLHYSLVFNPNFVRLKERLSEQYAVSALDFLKNNDLDNAQDAILESIRYNSKNTDSWISLGRILYYRGNYFEAARTWNQYNSEKKGRKKIEAVVRENIFRNLWYVVNSSNELSGVNINAILLNDEGERILLSAGDYQTATWFFRKATETDDKFSRPVINQARIALMLGDDAKALSLADKVLEKNASCCEALTIRGMVLTIREQREKALIEFQKCIKKDPKYAEPYAMSGINYKHMGNHKKAEAYLSKALELYPDHVPWRIELAKVFLSAGDMEKFWTELNEALVYTDIQNRSELELVIRALLAENPQ